MNISNERLIRKVVFILNDLTLIQKQAQFIQQEIVAGSHQNFRLFSRSLLKRGICTQM